MKEESLRERKMGKGVKRGTEKEKRKERERKKEREERERESKTRRSERQNTNQSLVASTGYRY